MYGSMATDAAHAPATVPDCPASTPLRTLAQIHRSVSLWRQSAAAAAGCLSRWLRKIGVLWGRSSLTTSLIY
ncbi:protein of unknown function [Pararobbsia alpina]